MADPPSAFISLPLIDLGTPGTVPASPEQVVGVVFDIQRYSLHDGPGLRTNVFLKGCRLGCRWCSNPESQRMQPQIAFFERNCFLCGDCVALCQPAAIRLQDGQLHWDHLLCNDCGACAAICTAGAFSMIGREWTAAEVIAEVLKDAAFYRHQGGLTLTGGEPTQQPEFTEAILRLAKAEGLHTALETCGACAWPDLARLLPFLDLVLFDLKHTDPAIHYRFTGMSNEGLLDNLRQASQAARELVLRLPLIPGFNADSPSLEAIADFILSLETVSQVHLLTYHTLGRAKYRALGLVYELEDLPAMKRAEAEAWAPTFRERGLEVLLDGS